MKRFLPVPLVCALVACQSPKPGADPETGEPVALEAGRGEKKRGWFRSRKERDEAADDAPAELGVDVPQGEALARPRGIDKSASLEEQFRQAAAAQAATGTAPVGRDGWRFSSSELKRVSRGSAASNPGAVDAIADYARALKKRGVQLIVVPVPPKSLVYADYLSPDWKPGRRKVSSLGRDYRAATANLRARGVSVVDATELLRSERTSKKGRSFPKSGAEVSPRAAQRIAATVAEVARTGGWLHDGIKVAGISASESTVGLDRSLGGSAETVPARAVRRDGGLLKSSSRAPLLVLGDAMATAGRNTGTSFVDQLAYELRVPVDVQTSATDGRNVPRARVLRKGVADPGYAGRKRCVVWIFNAAEFNVRDWRKVPLSLEMQESEETLRDADSA